MPYVAIKAHPKDPEQTKKVIDQINQVMIDNWGLEPEHICISMEEYDPAVWNEEVREGEILKKLDKMMILDGKKSY